MGLFPVGDSDFSLSHARVMLNISYFTICHNVYSPLLIRQANNVEENPGPTIFDIIDQQPLCLLTLVFFSVKYYCNWEK